MTLQEAFGSVEDHRKGPACRHDLKEMIVMAICRISAENNYSEEETP